MLNGYCYTSICWGTVCNSVNRPVRASNISKLRQFLFRNSSFLLLFLLRR
uniref:Uncharacterized protein n=1 Tax=Arundo donax TaxID=35708 RepID=A0A0A8ZZP4_ARUDO